MRAEQARPSDCPRVAEPGQCGPPHAGAPAGTTSPNSWQARAVRRAGCRRVLRVRSGVVAWRDLVHQPRHPKHPIALPRCCVPTRPPAANTVMNITPIHMRLLWGFDEVIEYSDKQ